MEFQKFNKIPRLSRDCTISEKLNGTNASVVIVEYGQIDKSVCDFITDCCLNLPENFQEGTYNYPTDKLYLFAGSRNRWINPQNDNYGFAKWAKDNAKELVGLGRGHHYGEWWGSGCQIGYGLKEKRFSLFNVGKWHDKQNGKLPEDSKLEYCPSCCNVVPILFKGEFTTENINYTLEDLKINGSYAALGFMNPEGIIIFHQASGQLFKKTILNDEKPKGV